MPEHWPDSTRQLDESVSPNTRISIDRDLQTINGTPRMPGIPVNIRKTEAAGLDGL